MSPLAAFWLKILLPFLLPPLAIALALIAAALWWCPRCGDVG
jgi:hypothetical protein